MAEDQNAIVVKDVYKTFELPHEQHSGIKQAAINIFNTKKGFETQKVLKDISFEIKKGEFFGIVGRNGSGKSTLLKLLAGIYVPDKGLIQVNGSLTPFIELGVGFNMELTGRENVFLNGALLGFDRKQMGAMYKDIVDFAEIEKFMDQKLKNYSSGMQVRLAFSIAIRAKSDILLLDEVLAVGDAAFQTKCFDYFYKLKKEKTTVIFVSHDKNSLERFCNQGILIDKGEIITRGNIKKVLNSYTDVVLEEMETKKPSTKGKAHKHLKGNYAQIQNTLTLDVNKKNKKRFSYGEQVSVQFSAKVKQNLDHPILGVTVWKKNNEEPVFASNTFIEGIKETGKFKKGETIRFEATLPTLLNDGEYYVEPAIANHSATITYDQHPKACSFLISGSDNPYSLLSGEPTIKVSQN